MNSGIILSESQLEHRRLLLFWTGVILTFLGAMSKVMIPGTIITGLQQAGLSPKQIGMVGGGFMYGSALSQFICGIFSVRYDGSRLLLTGALMFTIGSLLFPLYPSGWWLTGCRILTGAGAGTTTIGVWKFLAALFDKKFTAMLGVIQVISFCGPPTGTGPMVYLIEAIGWKNALMIPALLTLLLTLVIIWKVKDTIQPPLAGSSGLASLVEIVRLPYFWVLCVSSTTIFCAYYLILNLLGQKLLMDLCHQPVTRVAQLMMAMTIFTAVNNLMVSWLLKLTHGRCMPVMLLSSSLSFAGCLLSLSQCRSADASTVLVFIAYLMMAMPAGFFALYATIGKNMTRKENTSLAMAIVNGIAFLGIGFSQSIAGHIVQIHAKQSLVYPPEAFSAVFVFAAILTGLGLTASIAIACHQRNA